MKKVSCLVYEKQSWLYSATKKICIISKQQGIDRYFYKLYAKNKAETRQITQYKVWRRPLLPMSGYVLDKKF